MLVALTLALLRAPGTLLRRIIPRAQHSTAADAAPAPAPAPAPPGAAAPAPLGASAPPPPPPAATTVAVSNPVPGPRHHWLRRWRFWPRRKPAAAPARSAPKAPFPLVSVLRGSLTHPPVLVLPPQLAGAAPQSHQLHVGVDAAAAEAAAAAKVAAAACGDAAWAALLSAPAAVKCLIAALSPTIPDLVALACTSKASWHTLAERDSLWCEVYLVNEPLATPELRRLLTTPQYATQHAAPLTLPLCGLRQSAWLRTCCLLYTKPKIVLVLAGKDPILVRHLGQPEKEAEAVSLGINYHLDDFLDDEEKRFATEFPQIFQELNVGDLVITQDYKGAGCWTAVVDPHAEPSLAPYLLLKRNGHDTAGYGILTAEVAPPSFPLFYYSDTEFSEEVDRRSLKGHEVYWYAYTQLKCKSLYSWAEQELFQDLAF